MKQILNKKILTHIFILTLLFTFNSCSSDDEPTPEPTLEEIQEDIKNTFNGLVDCLTGYESGEFSTVLQDYFMINNGEMETGYSDFLTDQLEIFKFDLENFNMANYSGVYDWNSTNNEWDFTSNTQNDLIFNFPFLEGGNTNNMTITINDYEVQEVVFSFDTEYYPTKLVGSIEKDNTVVFSLDIDNVVYQIGSENVAPTNFDIEIITLPMTHFFTLDETSTSQFLFNYSSNNNGSCNTNFTINADTIVTDYTNIEGVDEFSNVTGTIGHDSLELVFSADIDSLNAIEEPTVDEINEYITVNVFLANSQVGVLEYTEIGDTSEILIVYNDGTTENADVYVNETLGDEIENIFSNFTN